MQILEVDINTLKFAEYNPREISKHDFKALVNSIKEFGFVEPVVVNKDNTIVGGHMRVRAAQEVGFLKLPVFYIDLPKHLEKSLNLALNRIHGDWDQDKLDELLYELKELPDLDINLTGFSEDEIGQMLDRVAPTEEDEVPEPPKEAKSKPGEVYKLGRHFLMCGDSTNKEHLAKLLNGVKVDSLVTDPPYGINYADKNEFLNKTGRGNRIQKAYQNDDRQDYEAWFGEWLKDIPFAQHNTYFIFMGSTKIRDLLNALNNNGYNMQTILVWVKNNHVLGRMDYNAKHEFCVYGWMGTHKFYAQRGSRTTVLEFDKPLVNDLHPTMKPVGLVARVIQDGTARGGVVLDLFGGSGTTLIAAEQSDRTAYLMEIDPGYCDVIRERYEKFMEGKK